MGRKRTANEIKSVVQTPMADCYKSYANEQDRESALKGMSDGLNDSYSIARTRDFSNLLPNISGRPGMTRQDYEYFRPDEAVPTRGKSIISNVESIYQRNGLIRNIIDLMGDFASQGIRISHPNKGKEKLLQDWWERVEGNKVSERICNLLYRHANVYIRYYTAKIRDENKIKIIASPDQIGLPTFGELEKKEIPFKYVFLDPTTVEPIGGSLSSFVNKPIYGIRLSEHMRTLIKSPKTAEEKRIVKELPADIKAAAEHNGLIPMPMERVIYLSYKKDDWMRIANPMIYSIIDDIILLEKLKLADLCALDGAVSKIRIFKLGNLENKIAPQPAAFAKLAEMLQNNTGGGTMDIVWGPDIDLLETSADGFQVLGEEKYKACLNNIYAALGIPPTLTGTYGAAGTTNNFISLKTLTERLEYGRDILTEFWTQQLALVCKSLDIRLPAQIEYDRPILANEDTEKTLLMNLADRNLISDELLRRRLGANDKMENVRLKRESKDRTSENRVPKAGPWHDPQAEDKHKKDLNKLALQSGQAAPSEIGMELQPKKPGESRLIDKQLKLKKLSAPPGGKKKTKKKGQPGQGRPKTKKDSKKRKTKTVRPRTRGTLEFWAKEAQNTISDSINKVILAHYDKKNMRSLTDEQAKHAETIKFGVLCNIEPFTEVNDESIQAALLPVPAEANAGLEEAILDFTACMKRPPNTEEIRTMQCSIFTDMNIGDDNEDI